MNKPIQRSAVIPLQPYDETSGSMTCSIARRGSRVRAQFQLEGIADLAPASPSAGSSRKNELWRATCFELFIAPRFEDAYLELNAAPSGDWNAYLFDRYRESMREAPIKPLRIKMEPNRFLLEADLEPLSFLNGVEWEVGISAVLSRLTPARVEYWALEHKAAQPDFHFRGAFLVPL